MKYFQLKPIRAARVSEISETTASAPVPKEEQVHFHIGNPLLDSRQSSAYLRIVLGIDVNHESLDDNSLDVILDTLGWEAVDKPMLELMVRMIQKSSPYMPRGGYSRLNPNALVKAFCTWIEQQQEPLKYDMGEQSARREMILASGGISEVLRIVLFSLSSYLEKTPAQILCYQVELPQQYHSIPKLMFDNLDADEQVASDQIEQHLVHHPEQPTFLLVGRLLEEETRRKLRLLSIEHPLFFIEANNAPNHLSLAREAKLVQRVIRLLTPGIFASRLHPLSTIFIAGNADFLKVIENVHFKLKGTPSATEVEFLIYLLNHKLANLKAEHPSQIPQGKPEFDGLSLGISAETVLPRLAEKVEGFLGRILDAHAQTLTGSLKSYQDRSTVLDNRIQTMVETEIIDEFSGIETKELLDQFVKHIHEPAWSKALQRSYLNHFLKHQPQYQPEACLVASGSSRTALGILGHHCGISEVVIPDLSWSYEQCFQRVHTVPLTESLELDVDAIIKKMESLQSQDSSWQKRGAVVINSPHNATGQVFHENAIHKLVMYCLQHNFYVIDDLSYQDVTPSIDPREIKTARQIADELYRLGHLTQSQADRLITVHSISKTDCLAGARLAVVEIRDVPVRKRFEEVYSVIQPNLAAILISYLFYRGSRQSVRTYWQLRNLLFHERTQGLLAAVKNLPAERNPFGLAIIPPKGSMYPLLRIEHLPDGVSLDWLASSLARQGIGLLPLATFARTEKGYETGRKSFRLTLGGADHAQILQAKTRRLLIDLNRIIGEEEARYNRKRLNIQLLPGKTSRENILGRSWEDIRQQITQYGEQSHSTPHLISVPQLDKKSLKQEFVQRYLPDRLDLFRTRLLERALISDEQMRRAQAVGSNWLADRLEKEIMKDSLQKRRDLFKIRSYDRTVHPTQAYSLKAEITLDAILETLIHNQPVPTSLIEKAGQELLKEYLGKTVSITSKDEADEIKLDLLALITAENYGDLFADAGQAPAPFLSFWSDWDGSNRPSGQGHQLVASIVMENVRQMTQIINLLRSADPNIPINPELWAQISQLPEKNQRFAQILNNITGLTHQLEQRYRGILPYSTEATPLQRWATRLNLRRDPVQVLLQHNDRYERKMLELRQQRRSMLEDYFALNKRLRKQLHELIPAIYNNRASKELLREVVGFRDLLQRIVITPRIHQGLITARDQFAIDTTVYNLDEINTITAKYGNPGMVLALQVSMSTIPDALISLDRKMQVQRQKIEREQPSVEIPTIWLIPLIEDIETVNNIRSYLDRMWDYSTQSRQNEQSPQERFGEIISEIFIAGSDLSQQVSQATGSHLYHKVKYEVHSWLADHGVAEDVRMKLGSGEPMQRQGGYYSEVAGHPTFQNSADARHRFLRHLPAAARQSTAYSATPLQGIFLDGDLRTFQSNLSEQLRFLPVRDFVSLLHHVRETQRIHRNDLIRAAETITESRLAAQSRSQKELERLTIGTNEDLYKNFLEELTDNFRHILYGREEDVIGLHAISYFIGRSLPQLRDRPTSRRKSGLGRDQSQQILTDIAEIIPFSKQGSLLRAIAHNQAQTVVLGINQLTTGLFRSLERFSQKFFAEAERKRMIAERVLPHLPVYEILSGLRIYQDWNGEILRKIENAIPAGNSAFVALREDSDAMWRYLPLFQQELLRRHGLNVSDFFTDEHLIPDLLPTLRPDLAVLLQRDLFNTSIDVLLNNVVGKVADPWKTEVDKLLDQPKKVQFWRSIIWEVMEKSLYQRVQSFSELATALYSIPAAQPLRDPAAIDRETKLSPAMAGFFRTARADDEMRQFLLGALEYLNTFASGNIEVPISIIRAMNDVERIAQIEETAMTESEQDVIRFCLLNIARLTGENG